MIDLEQENLVRLKKEDILFNEDGKIALNVHIKDQKARVELVNLIVKYASPEQLTSRYLNILSDYICLCTDTIKERSKERSILTDNRIKRISERETSFEGYVSKLEHGEDSIYNFIANDKNIIFTPKVTITEEDKEEIPGLKELCDGIAQIEEEFKTATGRKKYALKVQLIQMHQDQYALKSIFKPTINCFSVTKTASKIDLSETITIDEDGNVSSNGIINLFEPKQIMLLLCNYSNLKEHVYAQFTSDMYYLMMDLEKLIDEVIKEKYPILFEILVAKIDGLKNTDIQSLIKEKYNVTYSQEYISHLWRQKIPMLLADAASERYLIWYYTTKEKGKWKKCNRCGQKKLACSRFFSKNKSAKDGFYSICKECRKIKYQQSKK